ncbi:hypothetical protein DRO69_00930 [Candidatus Bathyarchaeota archaeon]|nr:MAG: hypothetical protein DRO69_00930 [Candidatus Bathyarchaeota archaeon]
MFQSQRKILPLIVLVLIALATCVAALLTSETRIPSVGTVKTVGVEAFWDINCTSTVTEIDWGLVEPGDYVNATIYLRNKGNAPITLYLDTENWSPSNASNYITLSWDYAGQTVGPGTVLKVGLTLTVSSNITGIMNFTFDIIIAGIG